jgi:hypothetical protein
MKTLESALTALASLCLSTAAFAIPPTTATPVVGVSAPHAIAPTVKVVAPADMRVKVRVSEMTNQVRVTVRPPSSLDQARVLATVPAPRVEPLKIATTPRQGEAVQAVGQAHSTIAPSQAEQSTKAAGPSPISHSDLVVDGYGHVTEAHPVGTFGGGGHPGTAGSPVPPGMVPPSQQPHSIAFEGYKRDSIRHSPGYRPPGDGYTFTP